MLLSSRSTTMLAVYSAAAVLVLLQGATSVLSSPAGYRPFNLIIPGVSPVVPATGKELAMLKAACNKPGVSISEWLMTTSTTLLARGTYHDGQTVYVKCNIDTGDATSSQRIQREKTAVQAVKDAVDNHRKHAGRNRVARVLAVGDITVQDGRSGVYTVMEDAGANVLTYVRTLPRAKRTRFVKYIVPQLLAGVQFLHRHGIFHLNIRPANLAIKNGQLRILDYDSAVVVRTGTDLVGSPNPFIMPPGAAAATKQAPTLDAMGARKLLNQQEVWSIGVCLYALLTDRLPYGGDGPMEWEAVGEWQHLAKREPQSVIPSAADSAWPKQREPVRFNGNAIPDDISPFYISSLPLLQAEHEMLAQYKRHFYEPVQQLNPVLHSLIAYCLTLDASRRPTVAQLADQWQSNSIPQIDADSVGERIRKQWVDIKSAVRHAANNNWNVQASQFDSFRKYLGAQWSKVKTEGKHLLLKA